IAFHGDTPRKLIVVDAAGYRERREAALQRAADRAVSDALDFGRPVELEPMSAAERRIVHTYLRDRTDVQTHSEGDEPDRRPLGTGGARAPVRRGDCGRRVGRGVSGAAAGDRAAGGTGRPGRVRWSKGRGHPAADRGRGRVECARDP